MNERRTVLSDEWIDEQYRLTPDRFAFARAVEAAVLAKVEAPESFRVTLDALRDENDALRARVAKLEHEAWHLLDNSEERTNEIVVDRADVARLAALLPEEHP